MADYTIRIEPHEGNIWGHVTVHRWSHRVASALCREVDAIVGTLGPILATPDETCASGPALMKWRKFMRLIGFHAFAVNGARTVFVRWG